MAILLAACKRTSTVFLQILGPGARTTKCTVASGVLLLVWILGLSWYTFGFLIFPNSMFAVWGSSVCFDFEGSVVISNVPTRSSSKTTTSI